MGHSIGKIILTNMSINAFKTSNRTAKLSTKPKGDTQVQFTELKERHHLAFDLEKTVRR